MRVIVSLGQRESFVNRRACIYNWHSQKSNRIFIIKECSAKRNVFLLLLFQDRIKLGSSSLFLYIGHPEERTEHDQTDRYNFDYFVTELAEHEGIAVELHTPRDHDADEDHVTQIMYQEFVDLMPSIAEANAISEELNKVCHSIWLSLNIILAHNRFLLHLISTMGWGRNNLVFLCTQETIHSEINMESNLF